LREVKEIYIKLLNEAVDVWRPAKAEHVKKNVYRILPQQYSHETESWQFEPGDEVICKIIDSSDGKILAAISNVRDTGEYKKSKGSE